MAGSDDDAGHPQTAAAHHYAATQLWAPACWPVWDDDGLVLPSGEGVERS